MSDTFACLVIADESAEFPSALAYAARMAKAGAWRLLMLHVIEPSDPAPWASVGEEMKRQAAARAEALLERFAAEAWAECGAVAEGVVREGDLRHELRRLIDEDPSIRLVVLATAGEAGGPGPLVQAVAKGHGWSARPVPVMIVPGTLSREEVRALAGVSAPA